LFPVVCYLLLLLFYCFYCFVVLLSY
jgi:hypothetical protein